MFFKRKARLSYFFGLQSNLYEMKSLIVFHWQCIKKSIVQTLNDTRLTVISYLIGAIIETVIPGKFEVISPLQIFKKSLIL